MLVTAYMPVRYLIRYGFYRAALTTCDYTEKRNSVISVVAQKRKTKNGHHLKIYDFWSL